MQYLYHVLSLREPVFIRPAELGGIQQVFFIKEFSEMLRTNDFELKMVGHFKLPKNLLISVIMGS